MRSEEDALEYPGYMSNARPNIEKHCLLIVENFETYNFVWPWEPQIRLLV